MGCAQVEPKKNKTSQCMKLYLKNANIINGGALSFGGIFIVNDRIDTICIYGTPSDKEHQCLIEADDVMDLEGRYVAPGVIDSHVHYREPGATHKGCIASESAAEALGGVTSFMDMPNNVPAAVDAASLENKFTIAAKDSTINYSFYIGATSDNLQELLSCDFSRVCGIKVFMGSSTGNLLLSDKARLEEIFSLTDALVAVHCEDNTIISKGLKEARRQYGANIPFRAHPQIRSAEACVNSTALALSLSAKYATRLHILHLSTAQEVEMVKQSKVYGMNVSAETCVQYLWFFDDAYDRLGALIKCNPAIKSRSDMLALRRAVRTGVIDTIATDHAPHLLEEKLMPYENSPSGIALGQFAFPMMVQMASQGSFSLPLVVEKMSHAPALTFGIEKRGFIREGYYADLVVFETTASHRIKNIASRCSWAPISSLKVSILHTIVNGHFVVKNGLLTGEKAAMELKFIKKK